MVSFKVFVILVLAVTCVVSKPAAKDTKEPFELNEFLTRQFSPKSWNGTWLTGDSFYYKDENGDIMKFLVTHGTKETFLTGDMLVEYLTGQTQHRPKSLQEMLSSLLPSIRTKKNYKGAKITLSSDQRFILVIYNVSALFRHSTRAQMTIFDMTTNEYHDVAQKQHIQYAEWSPKGHGLAYVLDNNLYYIDEPANVDHPKQITDDGIPGILYNGVPDWVYEEEVLASGSALWFSPDSKHLAFATFNDTNVPDYFYFIYGQPGNLLTQYPLLAALKYPKVGATNPVVKTYVVDLQEAVPKKQEILVIPPEYLPANYVLYNVVRATNEEVSFLISNRVQNDAKLIRCNLQHKCDVESHYKESRGWLELKKPMYSADGKKRVDILPANESGKTYYHLILTNVDDKSTVQLTRGRRAVTDIIAWDENNKNIYYTATVQDVPSMEHAYVVDTETTVEKCLTCETVTPSGLCHVGDVKLSPDFSHYVSICSGLGPDYVTLVNNLQSNAYFDPLCKQQPSETTVWEDNQELVKKLSAKMQPIIQDIEIPIEDGHIARARLYLPPDYTTTCSKKYPALVQVYAGPNSNRISDAYANDVRNYWITNRKYVYIQIDARGSGRDSLENMYEVYRRLGTVEIDDQINITRYLQNNVPCLDANKTGIWGWSYGGFATLMALTKDKTNVFKFGIAVAPVTNFIYYDTTYTERYMGLPTPEDNLKGYNNTDVSRNVEALRGKSFFIIHGNADDNVHYQQSMLLARALEAADIQFRQMSYPDENHSLSHVYPHLYHTLDRYIAEQFGLPLPTTKPRRTMPKKDAK